MIEVGHEVALGLMSSVEAQQICMWIQQRMLEVMSEPCSRLNNYLRPHGIC